MTKKTPCGAIPPCGCVASGLGLTCLKHWGHTGKHQSGPLMWEGEGTPQDELISRVIDEWLDLLKKHAEEGWDPPDLFSLELARGVHGTSPG